MLVKPNNKSLRFHQSNEYFTNISEFYFKLEAKKKQKTEFLKPYKNMPVPRI